MVRRASHALAPTQSWAKQAACRFVEDVNVFFPREENNKAAEPALQICRACPVAEACFWYAVDLNDFNGIWGGLTGPERRRALRNPRLKEIREARREAKRGAA